MNEFLIWYGSYSILWYLFQFSFQIKPSNLRLSSFVVTLCVATTFCHQEMPLKTLGTLMLELLIAVGYVRVYQ